MGFDPRQAMKWSVAARQLASKPVIWAVFAGIGNLRFKVSQTLPRPSKEQIQITDLTGECRKKQLADHRYDGSSGSRSSLQTIPPLPTIVFLQVSVLVTVTSGLVAAPGGRFGRNGFCLGSDDVRQPPP